MEGSPLSTAFRYISRQLPFDTSKKRQLEISLSTFFLDALFILLLNIGTVHLA
jgi:hypothetical protein